ncbi:MAG: hypothetical protein HY708_03315 [Ignavibacteriae bacterium]|nr:hypothetical protein [Ignavibacteriota bacterium]
MAAMNAPAILRYTVLTLSSAVMGLGILVIAGWGQQFLADQHRIILGAVVFLYGAYRFAIAFFRNPDRS